MGASIKFIKINNDIKDDVNNYSGTKREKIAQHFLSAHKNLEWIKKKDFQPSTLI